MNEAENPFLSETNHEVMHLSEKWDIVRLIRAELAKTVAVHFCTILAQVTAG